MEQPADLLARRLAEAQAWWELRQRSDDPEIALPPPVERPVEPPGWRDARTRLLIKDRNLYRQAVWSAAAKGEQRLRTRVLDPEPDHEDWNTRPAWEHLSSATELVEAVVAHRAEILCMYSTRPLAASIADSGGRVIVFQTQDTDFGGSEWASSAGYFDNKGEPPWDFWLTARLDERGYVLLYAWVPAELVRDVESGVEASSVACVRWATGEELRLFSTD